MASRPRLFKPRFADHVVKGDVLARNMQGDRQMVVIAPPFTSQNLVGERKFVHLKVRMVESGVEGEMIYLPHEATFVATQESQHTPS
jgi:hypothetical protein